MIGRVRSESGQAVVVTILFMSVLLGGVAVSLDVGSWYRQSRDAQTAADAAALSGAQSLPANPTQAASVATQYANENGGGLPASGGISFRSDFEPNDTVVVDISRTAPGFFSRFFGIDSVQVHATAAARSAVPMDVEWAAPIAVSQMQTMLLGTPGCPCFGPDHSTSIPLGKNGDPGSFGLIDLEKYQPAVDGACPTASGGGNAGSSTLGDWIQNGFDQYLQLGCYASDPGAKFNSAPVGSALNARFGTNLLFPVYSAETGNGANAQYDVIGWAAFDVQKFDASGSSGDLYGWFSQVVWAGIQSTTAGGQDFGVHTIALVN